MSTSIKKQFSFFGKFRNDVIKQATGDILIDVPDDHQFLYRGDWCQDIIDIFNDRIQKTGKNDASLISFKTKFAYRVAKTNNKCGDAQTTDRNATYYMVETSKTHEDWHAMSRENLEKVGLYPQLENMPSDIIKNWNESTYHSNFHHTYLNSKFLELGLKRVMTKLPIMHDCGDSKWEEYADLNQTLFEICESEKEFRNRYGRFNRCMSMEEFEKMNPVISSLR